MTITTYDSRNEYTATAGQTVFNYTFKIFASSDLNVYITPAGQVADDSTDIITAYTVTGVGDEDGGTIVLTTGASNGDLVTIVSDIPSSRTTDYQNNGDFRPDTVNADFDRVVSLVKQVEDLSRRAVLLQESQQGAKPYDMPQPVDGQFLRWKSTLDGLENVQIGDSDVALNIPVYLLSDYASLSAALTVIGSTETELWIDRDETISSNTSTASNVTLRPINGNVLSDDSNNASLTINGKVMASESQQWLSWGTGSGSVTFYSGTTVHAAWFGAVADGTTNSQPEVQQAIDSLSDECTLIISGDITFVNTTFTQEHTVAAGTYDYTYPGAWKVANKNNIKIIVNGVITETVDPYLNGLYYLFSLSNVTNSYFYVNFVGYSTLTDAMVTSTNPLDNDGAIVIGMADRCYNNNFDVKAKACRAGFQALPYTITSVRFTDATQSRGFCLHLLVEDSKYGCANYGISDSNAVVQGVNCKRTFRLQGYGDSHYFEASTMAWDKFSWDTGEWDILIKGEVGTHQNIIGNISMHNRYSIVSLQTDGYYGILENVDLTLNMTQGALEIYNTQDSATADTHIRNVNIRGSLTTSTATVAIRIKARENASDTLSTIEDINITNFTFKGVSSALTDYIRFESGHSLYPFKRITLSNIYLVGTSVSSNDDDGDGYYDGALVFNYVDKLFLNNIKHDAGGMASTDNTLVFLNCKSPVIQNVYTPGLKVFSGCSMESYYHNNMLGITEIFPTSLPSSGATNKVLISASSGVPFVSIYDGSSSTVQLNGNGYMLLQYYLSLFAEYASGVDPSAPSAGGIIYTQDNGAGKTKLMVRFPTGATQQLAIEP